MTDTPGIPSETELAQAKQAKRKEIAAQERTRRWVANHPDEMVEFPKITLALIILLGIFFGAKDHYSGNPYSYIFGAANVSGLFILETFAASTTLLLSIAYTLEIIREASEKGALGGLKNGRSLVLIGIVSALNCGVIVYAWSYLRSYTVGGEADFSLYVWYIIFTFFAFFLFTVLDFIAMYKSRGWKLARSYCGLTLYCDGPTAIAFFLLLMYIWLFFERSGRHPSVEIIGGAVAMQLIIANAIYLGITTNFVFAINKKYACDGVERS